MGDEKTSEKSKAAEMLATILNVFLFILQCPSDLVIMACHMCGLRAGFVGILAEKQLMEKEFCEGRKTTGA